MEKTLLMMDKIKLGFTVIVGLFVLYIFWQDHFGTKDPGSVLPPTVYRDTIKIIDMSPAIHIRDTVKKKVVVVIPSKSDSILIMTLLDQQDSLINVINSLGVKSIAKLDTIMPQTLDTLNIAYSEYDRFWDVYVGLAPRKVNVETKFVYLPAPKIERSWWDNPWVSGAIGLGTGLIIGVAIK